MLLGENVHQDLQQKSFCLIKTCEEGEGTFYNGSQHKDFHTTLLKHHIMNPYIVSAGGSDSSLYAAEFKAQKQKIKSNISISALSNPNEQ